MRRVVAMMLFSAACSSRSPQTTVHASLGARVVARVASEDIVAPLVAKVAERARVTPSAAVDLLVVDALEAAGAQRLPDDPAVRLEERAALAAATVARVEKDARRKPISDAELGEATAEHWTEVDRPETLLVVHAVVRRPAHPDATLERQARAFAGSIAASVGLAKNADDFEARARAVKSPNGDLSLVVERLPPFTEDGRVAVAGATAGFDKRFCAGAFGLTHVGQTSDVIESDAGWHVVRLLERLPAHVASKHERRKVLGEEIILRRLHRAIDDTIALRRGREGVEVSNGLDELLGGAFGHETQPSPQTRE